MPQEEHTIVWTAPTHAHFERSIDWYWALGILALCGSIASVLWGNVLFAAIIALAAVMLGTIAARGPRRCEVHINTKGILLDHEFYPYHSIHSFWIETHHIPSPKLFLSTTGVIHPHIAVLIEEPADPEEIRAYLREFVTEESNHSISTIFADFLGL